MSALVLNICFFFIGAILTLMVVGICIVAALPGVERWNKRFSITLFSVLALCMLSLLFDMMSYGKPDHRLMVEVASFFESLFISLVMPLVTIDLLHRSGERWQSAPLFRAVVALWVFYMAALVVAQFTPWIYTISPDGLFERGPHYPVMGLPLVAMLLLTIIGALRRRKKISEIFFSALMVYLVPMTVIMIVHMNVLATLFIVMGLGVCAIAMYALMLSDQIENYMHQQREITKQRSSIMVLQMRPHFISNTMMSIYYLIQQDPEKAQQVTLDFTTYLRRNFTALARESLIPFSEELEHTRAYLSVEQIRYEGELFVEVDAPHTDFRLPSLTLQPIVENAVKHGLDPELEPLHVTIRTRKTPRGSVITVEDTGPGFAPADDEAPHIALANIRERLDVMCGGELAIASRTEGGTIVTAVIPDDRRYETPPPT